ncbi:MAG: cytochrome c3 family protein [Myxococcota bacterium]|nr:cytochrome c3 family protein [Myxococcota bacterium]
MRSEVDTMGSARGLKVTIAKGRSNSPLEKAAGLIAMMVGFGGALVLGYWVFPAVIYAREDQPMQFNHAIHMGDKGKMSCEDCHAFREDGTFVGIPPTSVCADCHSEPLGTSAAEKQLIDEYITPGKEIPWLSYSRQPDNAFFPHVAHVKTAGIPCDHCHGTHAQTTALRPLERNRLTGYSRDIWGANIAGIKTNTWDRMKMDDCAGCHQERGIKDSCLMCHK